MSFSKNLVMASFNCKALVMQSNTLLHRVFKGACNLKAPLSTALAFLHIPLPFTLGLGTHTAHNLLLPLFAFLLCHGGATQTAAQFVQWL